MCIASFMRRLVLGPAGQSVVQLSTVNRTIVTIAPRMISPRTRDLRLPLLLDVENVRVAIAALDFGHRRAERDGCPIQPRGAVARGEVWGIASKREATSIARTRSYQNIPSSFLVARLGALAKGGTLNRERRPLNRAGSPRHSRIKGTVDRRHE